MCFWDEVTSIRWSAYCDAILEWGDGRAQRLMSRNSFFDQLPQIRKLSGLATRIMDFNCGSRHQLVSSMFALLGKLQQAGHALPHIRMIVFHVCPQMPLLGLCEAFSTQVTSFQHYILLRVRFCCAPSNFCRAMADLI